MKSYIYIIREGSKKKKNYFKIGSSKDVVHPHKQRIRAIQIGNPRKLFLLKKIYNENHFKLEHFLHQCIIEFHHRGEWFYLNQELLLNKLEENIDAFTNLNSTEINKIKSPLKFLSNSKQAKSLAQKSIKARRQNLMNWAKEVNFLELIEEGIKTLENPNLKNVANFLNNKGLKTRRGCFFSGSNLSKQLFRFTETNLSQQLNRLNWNWKKIKENCTINENLT